MSPYGTYSSRLPTTFRNSTPLVRLQKSGGTSVVFSAPSLQHEVSWWPEVLQLEPPCTAGASRNDGANPPQPAPSQHLT
ncbi:hypothetical protein J4Q44_G00091480 [Coregonus suidteri]|uniref:Uncharacterized protein n=1 Tax=Coregonus suidteri TaxID=861788 RepID=A0AAN8MWD5_9TELE